MTFEDKISRVVAGPGGRRAPATATLGLPLSGAVGRVLEHVAGGITYTLDAFDGGRQRFGPVTVAQPTFGDSGGDTSTMPLPPIGSDVLVVWVGPGIDDAWVVAWR